MEEQLKALTAQVEALKEGEIALKAQIVELSAKAEERDEMAGLAEAARAERDEMSAALEAAKVEAQERAAALAALEEEKATAKAEAYALKREQVIGALLSEGKITPAQRESFEMAYDLEQETGRPVFSGLTANLTANAAVNLKAEGHGKPAELDPHADQNTEKAKALAAAEGITFMAAYSRVLSKEP